MSYADEARYGRVLLFLLNVCPFTLRHVINDYHIKNGYTSLQDFLDKNKHDLYHILNRRCCCRLIQSRSTPMNRSQWDLLFIRNSSSCRTGYIGDCPCPYDAKPGVTSDVMDITLCCLIIKNICSRHVGINMSHIETIRTIRNHIIHAESAQLDVLTYNGYWNQVKTALLDLANQVSPTVHTDTLSKIQDLETRVMNAGELGEIRKVIVDEKRIEVVEERVTNVEKDHETISKDNEQVKKTVKETAERVTQIEGRMTQTREELRKAAEHEHLEGEIRKRVSHVEKDLEAASKDNELVKKSVKETAEKVAQIEGSMTHVEKDLEAGSEDNDKVKKTVNETAEKVTQIEGILTNVDKNFKAASKDNEQIKKNVKETSERVTQIEGTMAHVEKDLEAASKDNEQVKKSVKETAEKVAQIEGGMAHVEKDLESASKDNEQVKKNVKETAEKVAQIEGGMAHLEKDLEAASKDNEQVKKSVKETLEKVTQIEGNMAQTTEELRKLGDTVQKTAELDRGVNRRLSQLEETVSDEADIRRLKQRLMKINTDISKTITLSPMQEQGKDELPIELLFAQVIIKEDQEYGKKGGQSTEYEREVKHPDEIFVMNGEEVRKVYMLGDAAHGKTTFCIWLVRNWCNAQQWDPKGSKKLDEWEKALKRFDFVFLLQFRHVSPDLALVADMICQDAFADDKDCWDIIRYVLSSNKYRSLIIMDGLDEWNPNELARKHLKCQGMPIIHVSSTVSCFLSMRPWMVSILSGLINFNDRVIEILGLSKKGLKKVVQNVLINHYKLKDDPPKLKQTFEKIVHNLDDKSLKSFMQIPLLAVVCVQIWYEGRQTGGSMTSFYAAMLNMLIERAYEKNEHRIEFDTTDVYKLPEVLSEYDNIENCVSVLLKLGKVAYEGLLSNETYLEFQKRKLEKQIGRRELQFALDVGLVSQKEAPSILTKNVSVHFFHKSVQEFLAAMYIITNEEVSDLFCKHLSVVKVIMELSNVIMFICGMCPSLGSVISQHVVSVTDSDMEICKYRESSYHNTSVLNLYKLEVVWYKEIRSIQTDDPVTFYVSDVYLDIHSDAETIRVTRELLSDHNLDIRSLFLYWVPTDREYGITNTEVKNCLCNKHKNTGSMVMVAINGAGTDRFVPPICIPSLRCLHLSNFRINNIQLCFEFWHQVMTYLTALRVLQIDNVTLGDGGLDLSKLQSLNVLKLNNVTLGDGGLDLFKLKSIRVLQLDDVNFGVRRLILSNTTSLHVLRLKNVTPRYVVLDLSDMKSICLLELDNVYLIDRRQHSYIELIDSIGISSMHIERCQLPNLTLKHIGLHLSANMSHIEKVELRFVYMSAELWEQFILSVLNIQHNLNVELDNTNVDGKTGKKIRSSPDFRVTRDGVVMNRTGTKGYQLYFTRVWPRSQVQPDYSNGNDILYSRVYTKSNTTEK